MPKADTHQYLPDADHDPPVVVPLMPSTPGHRAVAVGVIVALLATAVLVAPFANVQLGRIDSFVPVLQTVLSAADLLTATLLLAQYSVQPHRALLALASGYLFGGSFAFLQTLSFPGGYAPGGIIGDGSNTPAWFFVFWHTTFPLGILAYALLKDKGKSSPISTTASIAMTVAGVFGAVAALSWLVTVRVESLPSFYATSITLQTRLGSQINVALLLFGATTLLVLFARRRTVLDLWLLVTLFAWLPNFLVAAVASSVRFSVGWYAARGFALVASCMLLSVLLTEMIVLYTRLASALTMQRRERSNRLVSIDAATAAIAHEIRSPLASITLNTSTALKQLRSQPPLLQDLNIILKDIEEASLRVSATITSVRELFKKPTDQPAMMPIEDVVQQGLRLLRHELMINEVSVVTEFRAEPSLVRVDRVQLQQVILNLVKNAIEAMSSTPPDRRRLNISTRLRGNSSVLLSVHDTGPGVNPQDQGRIFEAFFTTKPAGMGLGLAICRTIVERYEGGLVLAESSPRGSTFEISLPTVPPAEVR
ncbi:GHKL domain-containing protein [Bradyrhizobium sp. KBS0727]|uniref:MASE4 domain-containing protein n=1 Tax=unclassified Bradyrhizobium TaxID=2631580 RepID=UPI00110E3529|nr:MULTISPECIES: MASE4 domain-containing protein [unclassified Bradyrhizobium]QDW40142.1 GHKL domain-containing protein [Bradyrhizobium sp. KBS0725]QDW46745.1 GHKL domain-containing protein [Bradyrhizobium sp. KBS0727]